MGTGGGFPGLPLAITHPGADFTLIDSVGKKLKCVDDFASALELDNVDTLNGRAETTRTSGNKLLTKAIVEDKNGFLAEAVWFNRKYLASQLKVYTGKKILLSGKVKYNYGKVSFSSPEPETDLSKISGGIVPIYSDAQYIPGRWIESKM